MSTVRAPKTDQKFSLKDNLEKRITQSIEIKENFFILSPGVIPPCRQIFYQVLQLLLQHTYVKINGEFFFFNHYKRSTFFYQIIIIEGYIIRHCFIFLKMFLQNIKYTANIMLSGNFQKVENKKIPFSMRHLYAIPTTL